MKRIVRKTTVTKTITMKGQEVVEEQPEEEYPEVPAEELEPSLAGKYQKVASGMELIMQGAKTVFARIWCENIDCL